MVNGRVALSLVIGAFVLVGITLLSIVALTVLHDQVPQQLYGVLTTVLGFLLGATGVSTKTPGS